jgi:hypothetical protein
MYRSRLTIVVSAAVLVSCVFLCACDGEEGVIGTTDGDAFGTSLYDGGGGGSDLPFDKCAAVTETAKNTFSPVDIVFTIDNSPSLLDEINATRANMNKFSKMITDSGLDAHIVLISCLPGDCDNEKFHGICIEPPLGKAGGCAGPTYDDSNPPSYLHVSIKVPSTRGLERTITTHAQWKQMMRPGSTRHVVIVSDDTDEWTAPQFNDALLKADPGFAGYKLHGIFAFKSKEDACAIAKSEPCCTYAAPGGEGVPYKELVKLTGGVSADLCQQSFDPVFNQIATSVIQGAKLSCSWALPAPPAGKELDPNKINVEFVDGSGASTIFGRVNSAADCAKVSGDAWYYDDPAKPTQVLVCPKTCTMIQGQAKAEIRIQFGCKTELAPIE